MRAEVQGVRPLLLLLLVVGLATGAQAGLSVWVDEQGVTHISDDPAAVPEAARAESSPGSLWDDGVLDPERRAQDRDSSGEEDRIRRLLRAAAGDLQLGETTRATGTLEGILRLDPRRPEAHWYLALLARQRGRFDQAETHLRAFLANAGERHDTWRAAARRHLKALEDERRLLVAEGPPELVALESENFRIHYDRQLGVTAPDFSRKVVQYLEEAHRQVGRTLGVAPLEPTGIVLYGKGAYLHAHRHRFSFATVGFFDGRIHVISAAHPAGELRALLFHEFTHAVFREHTAGDRPFWLNEGFAEVLERIARRVRGLSRHERGLLRRSIEAGRWVPLRDIATTFRGLDDEAARLAYLESAAAAYWIHERTSAPKRASLLLALDSGEGVDAALRSIVGRDTDGVDAAVQASILSEFPSLSY